MSEYIYRMKRLKGSSDKYGNCECCGRFVDSVYHLVMLKVFINHRGAESTTHDGNTFGHKACLADLTAR